MEIQKGTLHEFYMYPDITKEKKSRTQKRKQQNWINSNYTLMIQWKVWPLEQKVL